MSTASWLRRSLIYPVWVAKDRSPRLRYLAELEKSQYSSMATLRDIQTRKLIEMVEYAYRMTAYYRTSFDEWGVHPRDIRDERDLKKLPFLTKEHLRTRPKDFLSGEFLGRRLSSFKTGGSTGVPIEVMKDPKAVELINAASLRAFRWSGWNIGEPVGMVWGNPPTPLSIKDKLRNALISPEIYLDTMSLTEGSMTAFVRLWEKNSPTMMRGHSHSIFILASFCKSHMISSVRPKSIISSSMMLLQPERAVIEEAFQCKVTDLYGCEEVGLIACECARHGGMHVDMENNVVELVDPAGSSVVPDVDGAVVVTNLISKAMPLIRYKIGDVASMSPRQCSCGRTLPLMNNLSGRVADFLVRRDGSIVAGVSLVERTLTKFAGIAQMQIVQEDIDTIVLRVVKDEGYTEDTERSLIAELKESVGTHNTIRIESVQSIPQERSGKFRFSISRVSNPFSQ